jgi:VCBS repeat-containing protein
MTNRARKTVKSLLCRQTRPKKYYRGAHDGYLLPRDDIADSLIPLEPRCMFDAAGFVTGAENLADQVAETQADAAVAEAMNPDTTHSDAAEAETSALFAALGPATSSEIVFIDSRVEDYETLIAGIDRGAEVVLLDTESDGIAQIANTLEGRQGLTAIHIVSHGEAGELLLDDSVFNQDSMDGRHADALQSISSALSAEADVLIYGCNFGEGETGLSAMQAFADATGADVAASDDLTGAAELGGDWQLEATVGVIENGVIVNAEAMAAFNGVLTSTLDWSDYTADPQFPPTLDGSTAATVTEGGVQVSFTIDTDFDNNGNATTSAGNSGEVVTGVRGGLSDYLQMFSNGAVPNVDTQLYVISFDTVVNNLTFTLSDIDSSLPQFQDQFSIQAFNGATAVDLTAAEVTLVSAWDGVSAAGVVNFNDATNTFLARGGQNIGSGSNLGNATLAFTSAVDRIEITYSQGPSAGTPAGVGVAGNQAIGIHDMTWQADPNAVDDSIQTDEGTSVSQVATGVIANDELNSETGALVITELNGISGDVGSLTVLSSGATLTLGSDGSYTYDPTTSTTLNALSAGETAFDTFVYTLDDGAGGSDTATVTVTVTGLNDAPTATPDNVTLSEDSGASVLDLVGNDTDPDTNDTLSVGGIDTTGTSGSVTLNNGTVSYDPNGQFDSLAPGLTAIDSFTYTVTDGNGGTDTATVTITVTGENDPPDAVDDAPIFGEGAGVSVIDVLGNDTDAEGDTVSVTAVGSVGVTGIVAFNNGTVSYDPNGQFENLALGETAIDSFTYTVTDGNGGTDVATVNVTITGENDAPAAVPDNVTVSEDDGAVVVDLVGNDTDPDSSDNLTVGGVDTTGTVGTVTLTNGTVSYDPNSQFESLAVGETAIDTFTYTVTDGNGGTDTATVTVTVNGANDAPIATDDSGFTYFSADGASEISTSTLLSNDSDPDAGDVINVLSVDSSGTTGSVTFSGGTINYDPNGQFNSLTPGQTAIDTFVYTIFDGNGGTDSATVSITVQGVDVSAVDDNGTVSEDGPPLVVAGPGVLSNDFNFVPPTASDVWLDWDATNDTDGATNDTWDDVTTVAGVQWDFNTGGSISPVSVTSNLPGITEAFNLTAIGGGATSGSFDNVGAPGSESTQDASWDMWIRADDFTDQDVLFESGATGDGVSIILSDDGTGEFDLVQFSILDGTTADVIEVDLSAFTGLNATQLSQEFIQITAVYDRDASGSEDHMFLYINGQLAADNTASAPTTLNDWAGSDGAGLGQSNGGINATDTLYSGLITNDGLTDFEGQIAKFSFYNDNALTANEVNNNYGSVAEHLVVVGANGTTSDTMVEPAPGSAANAVSITANNGGSVTIRTDGSYEYDPNGQFESLAVGESALDTFDYTVTDGNGGSDTATVTITITGENDAPDAVDDNVGFTEDDGSSLLDLVGNDTDPDTSDTLSVGGIDTTGTSGSVSLVNGTVSYDPNGQFENLAVGETAIDTFSYTVTDGNGGVDTATVNVTITGVNDTPTAVNDDFAFGEDDGASVLAVVGNDTDPDGDTLTVGGIDTTGTVGSVSLSSGTVSYDPNGQFENLAVGETAIDTFTYTVTDGNGGTDTATVNVTITGVNDAPAAVDDNATFGEDDGASILAVVGNDTDPDGDTLTVGAIDTTGTVGTVSLSGGTVSYDPNGQFENLAVGDTAIDTCTYTVTDGNGGTDTATVNVTITGVNDVPTAVDDNATFGEDDGASILAVVGNDTDPDGDTLTVGAIDTTGTTGSVSLSGGTVSYDPNGQFESLAVGETAIDTFTYTVTDGNGGTDTATVNVTITGVNDVPTAVDDNATFGEGDGASVLAVVGNDTDPDGDTLTVGAIDTTGTTGSVSLSGGTVSYDPNGQFESLAVGDTAIDSFTYTVTDGNGGTDTATVNVTITGVNDAPAAVDDNATFGEDDGASILAVVGNDTDPDGDTLTVGAIDTTGTVGSVSLSGGTVSYDPNGQFENLAVDVTAPCWGENWHQLKRPWLLFSHLLVCVRQIF